MCYPWVSLRRSYVQDNWTLCTTCYCNLHSSSRYSKFSTMTTYEVIGSENVKYRVVVQASCQGEAEEKFFSHLRASHNGYIDTLTSGISLEVKELVEEA